MITAIFGKWVFYAIVAVAALVLYRATGSDLPGLISNIWALFNQAADAVLEILQSLFPGTITHTK